MKRIGLAALILLGAKSLCAQGYEVEVYRSNVLPRRTVMFEIHTNYTFRGADPSTLGVSGAPDDNFRRDSPLMFDPTCYNPDAPLYSRGGAPGLARPSLLRSNAAAGCDLYADLSADHVLRETVEAVVGVTSWSEFAVYAFARKQGSAGAEWTGATFRAKVQLPPAWRWPVGIAVAAEVEYEPSPRAIASWTLEVRPIIDRSVGRWYFAFNPTVARRLRGPGTATGIDFSPSGKLSFDATPAITAGLEYYGAYGRIGGFAPSASRLQQVYAALDLHLSPLWEVNVGAGFGLTPVSSQFTAKLVLGRALTW